MKIVLLGPPGAGKGTLAKIVKDQLKVPHISTGDILREEIARQSGLGLKVKSYMDKGELVPDDLVIALIEKKLSDPAIKSKGYMLDGFPRNTHQAQTLGKILENIGQPLDFALYMTASLAVILRRLSGRRVCKQCGTVYHLTNRPAKQEGVCDLCGAVLYQRADDNEETIRKRMDVYWESTRPMLDYYQTQDKLRTFDGDLETEEVFEILLKMLHEDTKVDHH